jgi:hypothetical protein
MKHLRYFESIDYDYETGYSVGDYVIINKVIKGMFSEGDFCEILKIDESPNWPYLIENLDDDYHYQHWVGKYQIRKATDEEIYNRNLLITGNKYNI